MFIKKAVRFFIGSGTNPRLNCGQAVACAFKDKFGLTEEFILTFASSGFGQAPGGVCGALYAVQSILKKVESNKIDEMNKLFSDHAGSIYCAEVRNIKKISCIECVKKAASILTAV